MVGSESSALSTHETVGQLPGHAWPYWVSAKDRSHGTYRSYEVPRGTLCFFHQPTEYTIRRSALSSMHASARRPIIKRIALGKKGKRLSGNKLAALSKAMAVPKCSPVKALSLHALLPIRIAANAPHARRCETKQNIRSNGRLGLLERNPRTRHVYGPTTEVTGTPSRRENLRITTTHRT